MAHMEKFDQFESIWKKLNLNTYLFGYVKKRTEK